MKPNKQKSIPEDWRYMQFGELVDYEQPQAYLVQSTEYNKHYKVPVLTAGKSFILGYTNEEVGVYEQVPVIIFDDFLAISRYVNFQFKVKSSAIKILKPKRDVADLYFVYSWMQSHPYYVGEHKRNYLSEYQYQDVSLPPLPEQHRIVSVLETWDNAIEKLERKIEIKKHIKKGLMQKMLTGEMRLPGFSGEWKDFTFNEIFLTLKKPLGLKTTYYGVEGWPIFDQSKSAYVSGYTKDEKYLYDFRSNGPVILFGDHSRIIKQINQRCAFGNDGIKLFKTKIGFDNLFVFYLLNNYRIPDTGYNRHFKYLEDAVFLVPPIKEQVTISGVLEKISTEIELMNKKLSKFKDQKKYLLNNLVRGKIRVLELKMNKKE